MKKFIKKIKINWGSFTQKQKRVLALTIAAVSATTSGIALYKLMTKGEEPEKDFFTVFEVPDHKLYLYDLLEDYSDICLTDNYGNPVNCIIDKSSRVILNCKVKSSNKKLYEAVIVNGYDMYENSTLTHGFISGKFIDKDCLDTIEVDSDEYGIYYMSNPEQITFSTGIPGNENSSSLSLKPKSQIIASTLLKKENGTDISWHDALVIQNNSFVPGYVLHEDLFMTDFYHNISFKNNYVIADSLHVRVDDDVYSDYFDVINYGQKVKVIETREDGDFGWSYISFLKKGSIIPDFGWVLNSQIKNGEKLSYLSDDIEIIDVNKEPEPVQDPVQEYVVKTNGVPLNLRVKPGLDSNTIEKLPNGTVVFFDKSTYTDNNYKITLDGYDWIKVTLLDGTTTGWVATEFLTLKQHGNNDYYSIDFGNFGLVNGKFGIDINLGTDPEKLDELLTNGIDVSLSYYVEETSKIVKPEYVILKCGATAWGTEPPEFRFGTLYNDKISNYREILEVLKKHNIPFSIYYYSQALNEKEAQTEIEVVKEAHEIASKYSCYTKHLFFDFEADGGKTRLGNNAKKNGKNVQTNVINNLLSLAKQTMKDANIHFYTDNNTLLSSIDIDLLEHKDGFAWITNISKSHEKYLMQTNISIDDIGMFQISDSISTQYGISVDIDFVFDKFYELINTNSGIVSTEPSLKSENVAIIDFETGDLLYGVNENTLKYPASVTKILTNYLVLKYCKDLNDTITLTKKNTNLPGEGYGSKSYKEGDTFTIKDAMYASLLKSDNPVTDALGDYIERITNWNIGELMTATARFIGCEDCEFKNAYGNDDGLDEYANHMVSANNMGRILAYAAKDCPELIEIMGTVYYEPLKINNLVKCLSKGDQTYVEGILGAKSGTTDNAGNTLISIIERDGKKLVIVCFGNYGTMNDAYYDTKKLADYGFKLLNVREHTLNRTNNKIYTYKYKKIN